MDTVERFDSAERFDAAVRGERDAGWIALGAWSGRQRAALALRHHEVLRLFALPVALVAVLVAGGAWLAVAWPRATRAATPATVVLTCPPAWTHHGDERVPGPPTASDTHDHLVPEQTPSAVVVCGYRGPDEFGTYDPDVPTDTPIPLTASAVLTGDLTAVAGLHGAQAAGGDLQSCPAYATITDGDDYLVGLSYPDGTVWVSAPGNHCAGSSNGVFSGAANLSAVAAKWLAAGDATTVVVPVPRPGG